MTRYSEALIRREPSLAYPELHRGPYHDDALKLVVVGDYANGIRVLQNTKGEFSNKTSVTPWWFKRPWDLALTALPQMVGVIRYADAMQTLDGARHSPARKVVEAAIHRTTATSAYRELFDRLLKAEVAQARGLSQGQAFDLKASLRRVRTQLLAHELGLPDDMQRRVIETTESQIRFLWGFPKAARSEHRKLAEAVGAMFDASQRLLDSYRRELSANREVPDNATAQLARASLDGAISAGVASSTLFGLVNAGEGTATSTGVRIAHHLVTSGRWRELATQPVAIPGEITSLVPAQSAIQAWQKDAALDVHLDGAERRLHLARGTRLLVVLGAMATDPAKGPIDVTFSAGIHECPGRGITYKFLTKYFAELIPALPNAALDGTPKKITTLTLDQFETLGVK